MQDRQRYSTGSVWEQAIGFSRSIRVGNLVFTAGTVAADENGIIQGETCFEQCCYIIDKLALALTSVGSDLSHVIRVVCYLVDLNDADDFTKAHNKYFAAVKPATTCIEVSKLFGTGTKVEMEFTAIAPE